MFKVKKVSGTRSKLTKLAKLYAKQQEAINKFRDKHEGVFEKLEEMEVDLQTVETRLKDLARPLSSGGKTLSLVNLPNVNVHVTGPQSRVEYDYVKARKVWSPDVMKRVKEIRVDPYLVEELIASGKFTDKAAKKAQLPREALTPRVTIKVTL